MCIYIYIYTYIHIYMYMTAHAARPPSHVAKTHRVGTEVNTIKICMYMYVYIHICIYISYCLRFLRH